MVADVARVRPGLVLWTTLAFAVLVGSARSSGVLVPRDGSAPIQVQSHRVSATLRDGLARTTVRQTFVNPHGRALEAVYIFPIPEGAALVALAMETGGQRLDGFLAERKTARRSYDSLVRRNIDPALVEQIGRSTFRLSVFPVLPDQPTVVELSWIETVPLQDGAYRYVYPLALDGAATTTQQDLTVSVDVHSSAPITGIESLSTSMDTRLVSRHHAQASMEEMQASLSRDVVVLAQVRTPEPNLAVHVYRPPEGEAYLAAVLTPPELEESQVVPRDITLALDVSGSMKGVKFTQAIASARWLVEHLRDHDRINVILFRDILQPFADQPVPATPENRERLLAYLGRTAAGGGTALGDVIQAACAAPKQPGRTAMVVVLTDGLPTVGVTDPTQLIGFARDGAGRGVRAYTFGVGGDVNASLLEGVATAGGGSSEVFRPEGEVQSRLQTFLLRTAAPAITDLKLSLGGRPVADLMPRPLPDVYLGEQTVLCGRSPARGVQELVVEGVFDGRPLRLCQQVELDPPAESLGAGDPVARDLYAHARLGFLAQALRLRLGLTDAAYFAAVDRGRYSTEDELTSAMIELSLETGVQCAYTAFLALLPEDHARLNPRDAEALEAALARATARKQELAKLVDAGTRREDAEKDLASAEGREKATEEKGGQGGGDAGGNASGERAGERSADEAGLSLGKNLGDNVLPNLGGGADTTPPDKGFGGWNTDWVSGGAGTYRGPGDVTPPGNPGGPGSPGPGSPTTGARGGPATGASAGRPTTGGFAGRKTGGGEGFERWEFWWEHEKERYLAELRGPKAPLAPAALDEIVNALLPLCEEAHPDIADSACLALARCAPDSRREEVRAALLAALSHPARSARESAALGLGVLGDPAAVPDLINLMLDTPRGRELHAGPVEDVVRAMAAAALGLIADPGSVPALVRVAWSAQKQPLELQAMAITALGLYPELEASGVDFLVQSVNDRAMHRVARAQVPIALARLASRSAELRVRVLPVLLQQFLDDKTGNDQLRSNAVALGSLGTTDDAAVLDALMQTVAKSNDDQTRHYSIMAVARIGARDPQPALHPSAHQAIQDFLRQEFQKPKRIAHRPWAALGLGVYARPATAQGETVRTGIAEVLRHGLATIKNPSDQAAMGIALGLLRDESSLPRVYQMFEDTGDQPLKGYLALSRAMLGDQNTLDLRRWLGTTGLEYRFRLQLARALELMGRGAIESLLDRLESGESIAETAAASQALGILGGEDVRKALLVSIRDASRQPLTRGFAAVALGILAQPGSTPWSVVFATDFNYRAKTSALSEILDLL